MRTAAIIGAGMIARTHMLACVATRHKMRLKGIADGGSGRAAGLAVEASKILGQEVRHFSYLGDIVNDREVEFAIVATPPNVREAVIAPLVGAGKHVLLEKPIACGIKEAVDLVSLCRQAGIALVGCLGWRALLGSGPGT
jgi:predicted dehydrogenase